jgi:hypothetical protein
MFIQTHFTHKAAQTKKIQFGLAIIFGAALSLTFYQEVLAKLLPFETLRLKIASYLSIVFFTVICFYFFKKITPLRFTPLAKPQKNGIILLSILTPFILAVAILNQHFFDKTIYFLLPKHTIQIEAPIESLQNGKDIKLTGINTQAQGPISFTAMKIKGWERKGNNLILTNPENNQITWQGKAGDKISLTFWSRPDLLKIKIHWDAAELSYNLFSGTPENVEVKRKFEIPLYAGWIPLAIAAYLSAVFGIYSLSIILVSFPGFTAVTSPKKNLWIIYALPMYTIWFFYLLIFWPGFMSLDSINQWGQVVTQQFVQANPVGHTLTMWLITRLWFSPAAVSLVQILVLGGILGWGIDTLRESGAPKWLSWLTAIVLAISPANSTLSITLWKDVLFSAVVVALTIIFFKIIASNGAWLDQKLAWLALGSTLFFVGIYRLNGLFVGLFNLLIISFVYGKYWKPVLKAGILLLTVYFLFTGPVFQMLNVRVKDMRRDELVIAHLLAGHMKAGTSVVLENKELLMPAMTEYPWPYICYRNSTLFFSPGIDRTYLVEHSSELLLLALKATWRNPLKTLEHFACQGASVYRIPQEYPNEVMMVGIEENNFGLKPSSLLPGLYLPLLTFMDEYINNWRLNAIWLVWRMPFWMYLSVLGCIIFCIRNRDWKPFLILMPGLLTVLPYLILTLGQIFRYVYSMFLIGILLSGYFLIGSFTKQSK